MSENCHNGYHSITCPKCWLLLVITIATFYNCNNTNDESAFAGILQQQPFSPITDSIKQFPENAELYFRRGDLLNSNNFPEPALADFRQAWNMKKEERYALGIASVLLDKKPDSATAFLQEALKIFPTSLSLQLATANAYAANGQVEQALEICNRSLLQDSALLDMLRLKAELLEKKGSKSEAVEVLEQAYRLTPYDIELNYSLALKYAESKNPKVISLCDSLIKVDTLQTHAEPNYYKGIFYSNTGEKQKAINEFNEALHKDYYFLDGYIEKAAAQFELKQYTGSVKTLELLLTISPKNADGYYWLAKNLEALGNKEQANINYQKAWGLDNTMEEARNGIQRTK